MRAQEGPFWLWAVTAFLAGAFFGLELMGRSPLP